MSKPRALVLYLRLAQAHEIPRILPHPSLLNCFMMILCGWRGLVSNSQARQSAVTEASSRRARHVVPGCETWTTSRPARRSANRPTFLSAVLPIRRRLKPVRDMAPMTRMAQRLCRTASRIPLMGSRAIRYRRERAIRVERSARSKLAFAARCACRSSPLITAGVIAVSGSVLTRA